MKKEYLNILKDAVLMEIHGKAFYENAAKNSKNKAVIEFFKDMAEEEEKHIEILKNQFESLEKNNKFDLISTKNYRFSEHIISKEIRDQVSSTNYESTAIHLAILLEKKSHEFYSDLANTASNNDEKTVYKWLSDWEKSHLDSMIKLQQHVQEQIWFDSQFWPF